MCQLKLVVGGKDTRSITHHIRKLEFVITLSLSEICAPILKLL